MQHNWQTFFERYAGHSIKAEAPELAAMYGDGFVAAGPRGSYAAKNDEAFLCWLHEVFRLNEAAGMQSLRPVHCAPVEASPHYQLVKVRWAARFAALAGEVEFDISYLVFVAESEPKIVGYVSHEDQEERMRQEGLLTSERAA